MPKEILGVSFDFGSTLLDYTPCISIVWSRVAKHLGIKMSPDDPRIREGIQRQTAAFVESGIPDHKLTREGLQRLNRHVLDAMEIEWAGLDQERLNRIVREEFDRIFQTGEGFQLYPGVRDTLERLHSTGLRIGMLSNCPADLGTPRRNAMKALGILDFFDAIILSGEVSVAKPEKAIFEIALKALGIEDAGQVIHVGDSPFSDVQGARNAGLIPVLFDPQGLYSFEDVVTIRKMSDILDMLHHRIS